MVDLSIRPYRPADRDAVVALWRACGLSVWYNDPDRDIALWRAAPNALILVGEAGGRVVATTCVGHDGHRGWPYYVAVDPDRRGRGHGRRLMRHAEAWLARRGILKMNLIVRRENADVQAFYRALGYTATENIQMGRWLTEDGEPSMAPAGATIRCTITHLEMTARPSHAPISLPHGLNVALLRARQPGVAFYRHLYDRIGAPWLWYERRAMDEAELGAILADEKVEVYVLYADGVPAGYAELDRRAPPDVELAYFGLMPEFVGQGLGAYLLGAAIDLAWRPGTKRLWVHTNTLDHPKALPLYQRFGFVPFKREDRTIPDPRLNGLIPPV